jgi:hypothetical protein
MPNPPKPSELKRLTGNPGKRALPNPIAYIEGGYIEPFRPLEVAGKQLWDAAMKTGENWIARNSDTQLLLLTCEQMDRRTNLIVKIAETSEWRLYRALHDLEKMISSNLSMLGFTPADRSRLGVAEVKVVSKLEELMQRKAERVATAMAYSSSTVSD